MDQPRVGMARHLQHFARQAVGMRNQRRPGTAIVGTMPANTAEVPRHALQVLLHRPAVQAARKIVLPPAFQQPVRIEDHQPAAQRMLAEGQQDLPLGQLHGLGLVNALVQRDHVAAAAAEVGVVTPLVEVQFAEPAPGLAFVRRDRGVQHIPVGEEVLGRSFALGSAQPGLAVVIQLGQGRGVVPHRQEPAVAHPKQQGHGDRGVEARGGGHGPRLAAVVRKGLVMAVQRGADQHPQPAAGKLDHRRLAAVVLPAHPLMRPLNRMRRRTGKQHLAPGDTVVVRQQDAGLIGTVGPMLDGLHPAAPLAQRQRQARQESHVGADLGLRQHAVGPRVRTKHEETAALAGLEGRLPRLAMRALGLAEDRQKIARPRTADHGPGRHPLDGHLAPTQAAVVAGDVDGP